MAATAGAAQRFRRTWPQRLLIAFNIALIISCLSAAGGLGYFYYRFGQLPRIDIGPGILTPEQPPGEPQNFLLVGSDTRAFVEAGSADQESFGDVSQVGENQRADTIILLRVDPRAKTAAMLSFPRDLWVTVAGTGRNGRINTAFFDGPDQLIETIRQNFNVPIHHYAQVDFQGFQNLVDAVGGVTVYVPAPMRDQKSGLLILDTGCVKLHGDQALSYVRSRQYEYQEDGRWRSDPRGDLGRIERQQDFVKRAIKAALSRGLTNPSKLNKYVNIADENVQISRSLDLDDILGLGRQFRSLSPETLQTFALPVTPTRRGEASVVEILEKDKTAAELMLQIFRGEAPHDPNQVSPSGVNIRVLNGSGTPGQASETTASLQAAGFSTTAPGDAEVALSSTTIRYGAGQEAKAHLLARYLASGAVIEPFEGLQGVDVVLITGEDYQGVLATPRAADETTTTTMPPETTTTAAPDPAAPPPC